MGIDRIALAVDIAPVEGQPVSAMPIQFGGHKYLVLVYGKVHQRSFIEGKEQFPVVAAGAVLFQSIVNVLPRKLIFELQRCHRYAV